MLTVGAGTFIAPGVDFFTHKNGKRYTQVAPRCEAVLPGSAESPNFETANWLEPLQIIIEQSYIRLKRGLRRIAGGCWCKRKGTRGSAEVFSIGGAVEMGVWAGKYLYL